jgi:hypothetical protein
MFESAATEFVLQLDCRALRGFVFRVVKRIGYFVPNRGRPPRSSPGNVLARTRAVLISGGEDFGYFALTEPP